MHAIHTGCLTRIVRRVIKHLGTPARRRNAFHCVATPFSRVALTLKFFFPAVRVRLIYELINLSAPGSLWAVASLA